MNQCDGCRAGIPVDENGNHQMGFKDGYRNLQACERRKYEVQKGKPKTKCSSPVFVPDTLGEELSAGQWMPCWNCPECQLLVVAQILIVAKKALKELQDLNKGHLKDGEWEIIKGLKRAIKKLENT